MHAGVSELTFTARYTEAVALYDIERVADLSFFSPMAGKESKKARHARLRQYVESLPFDAEIRDQRILEILRHHPNWSLKTNGGKWAIYKKRYFNAWRLEIVDQHGTFRDDISCDIAVRASLGLKTSPSQRALVSRAARNSIHRQQILPFRYSRTTLARIKTWIIKTSTLVRFWRTGYVPENSPLRISESHARHRTSGGLCRWAGRTRLEPLPQATRQVAADITDTPPPPDYEEAQKKQLNFSEDRPRTPPIKGSALRPAPISNLKLLCCSELLRLPSFHSQGGIGANWWRDRLTRLPLGSRRSPLPPLLVQTTKESGPAGSSEVSPQRRKAEDILGEL